VQYASTLQCPTAGLAAPMISRTHSAVSPSAASAQPY
jgi:hypothetical protein